MANNYYVIQHGSIEETGDSAGTNNLPGQNGTGTVFMTITPDTGYMIRTQSFTIAGNAAGNQYGNQYFFNGVTQSATHQFNSSQIESILANNPDAIQLEGVSQEQLDLNNGNIISDITMRDAMSSAFVGQEISDYNYTANIINVEVTFKNSFVFPSNDVTVKIDFDGTATEWIAPVGNGSFRWILTNKIWPSGKSDSITGNNRAYPNPSIPQAQAQNPSYVDEDIGSSAFQAAIASGYINGGTFFGKIGTHFNNDLLNSWNEHEAVGKQDSFCIENAVIRPVRQWYRRPLGFRYGGSGEGGVNYTSTWNQDFYTHSLLPALSNSSTSVSSVYTWNSSESKLAATNYVDFESTGLPTFNDGDNVVDKLVTLTGYADPNIANTYAPIQEFTPTNYQINNDGTVGFAEDNPTLTPRSYQIRFAIHGQEGYECLVENFGVMMHGFTLEKSTFVGSDYTSAAGSSISGITNPYDVDYAGTEGEGQLIYHYKNNTGNPPPNTNESIYHQRSPSVVYDTTTTSPELRGAGSSPWLLDYAVNGYLDGEYGGGDGEALVGTWLDQRLYASPAVWWKPKKIQSENGLSLLNITSSLTNTDANNLVDIANGFLHIDLNNDNIADSDLWPYYLHSSIGEHPGTSTFATLSEEELQNVGPGTPLCEQYLGRRDKLSDFTIPGGNQVTPYHPIGFQGIVNSTENQFQFYGEGPNTSFDSVAVNAWWKNNYSLGTDESVNTTGSLAEQPVKYIILKQCDHSQILNSSDLDSKYIFQYNNTGSGTNSYEYAQESGDKFIEVSIVLQDGWIWDSSLYNNADGSPTVFLTNIFGKATPIQTPDQLPMPFNVELIDNLSDNNSGTLTITDVNGKLVSQKVLNSGFKNQQTIYSISGSSIKGKPKKIATVKIEAGANKNYFTKLANLKVDTLNGGNLKMIPQKDTNSIISTAGRITTQIFDVIYTNENQAKKKFRADVKNKGNKTKAFLNFKVSSLLNRTRTIKDVTIGGSTLNPNGEIRDIVLHGSPNTSFVITLTDKNEDSILSRTNSTTVNSKGVTIPTLSDVINRRGVYKFKQRFPGLELIKRTAINGSMAASGATRIIFDDLTGVEVGDRVLMSSIGATEATTVTALNPTGGNANECDVSRSITAADNTLARFKRPRQYNLNITPSSSLGPNMPTSDPTYTLKHYNDIVLTFKASAGTSYDITHVNGVATGFSGTGEDHSSSYIGKPNKTAAQLENVSYVKKDVTLVYTLNGKGTNAFSVRTPFFSNEVGFIKAGEPYASTPTYFGGGSDWTNTIPSENGGTIVSVRELHTALSADGGTANGICTITIKFEIEKWGLENVTMDLDLDRVLTAS